MAIPTVAPKVKASDLRLDVFPREVRTRWLYRRYYGRGIDLAAIENALRGAEVGLMADITDLAIEARQADPHLASVLQQRINPLVTAQRHVKAASSFDVDKKKARDAATSMAAAIAMIPRWSAAIRRAAWALFFGRSAQELHWDVLPEPIGIAPFQIRWLPVEIRNIPPRHLSFGTQRDLKVIDPTRLRGYFQDEGDTLDDYPGKFLTWMPEIFNETREREGLAPPSMYWAFFKRFSWRMRMLLTEIFGIPWRVVKAKDPTVGDDELDDAAKQAQRLGAETTAKLSPGIDLDVVTPPKDVGQLFSMSGDDIDKQMSKLVLTTSSTTDAQPTGLGANTTSTLRDEKILVNVTDADALAEELTEQMIFYIALVNWGPEAAQIYTPTYELDASLPKDRGKELDIVDKSVSMGISCSIDHARSVAGIPTPGPDEPLLRGSLVGGVPSGAPAGPGELGTTPTDPLAKPGADGTSDPNTPIDPNASRGPDDGQPPASPGSPPAPTTVEIDITPSDLALIVRVDEARTSKGLPPIGGEDGNLTIAAFKAKYANTIAEGAAADAGKTKPTDPSAAPSFGAGAPDKGHLPPPVPPKPTKASRDAFAGFEDENDCIEHLMRTEAMSRSEAEIVTRAIKSRAGKVSPELCGGCGRPHHRFGGW